VVVEEGAVEGYGLCLPNQGRAKFEVEISEFKDLFIDKFIATFSSIDESLLFGDDKASK